MNRFFLSCIIFSLICVGCGSLHTTTAINSYPQGAKIWVDGEYVGETPVAADFYGSGYPETRRVVAEKGGEKQDLLIHKTHTWVEGHHVTNWTSYVIFDFRPGRMVSLDQ